MRRSTSAWLGLAGLLTTALTAAVWALPAAGTLDIYWIDVEGGAATLIVTPEGQSVLMDTGFAGFGDRDASRVAHVITKEAGLTRLDYFVASHFHSDHLGGLPALAKKVEIGAFIDHGQSVDKDPDGRSRWEDDYHRLAGNRRRTVKPGERLALRGVDLIIVAAHSQVLPAPLSDTAANPLCASFKAQPDDPGENGKSLGYLLRAGRFEFVNLGDLSWNFQHRLACPVNLLGTIDLFQVTHHGVRDDVLPQQMWAMAPAVAVMNNGPTKGAGPVAVETVLGSPGLEDLWSLHRAVNNDAAHNAQERMTANVGDTDGCAGAWIRARVDPAGTYTLTNSRNSYSKTYRIK